MRSFSIIIVLFTISYTSVNGSTTCSSNADCTADNVLCSSDYSCQRANSLTGKYEVECAGYYSCQGVDNIIATDNTYGRVECSGEHSCAKTNIDAKQNVYCKAERSCKRSTITAGGNVYLQDQYSVQGATVTAEGSILIDSKEGAARAQSLTAGQDVFINGIFGAATTKITAGNKVTCIGETSCFNTRRIASSTTELTIIYNGDNAGQFSNVFCPKSGTCTINCINGCVSNTVIYYTRNSGLSISPSECDPANANRPTNTCPTFQKGSTMEYDEWFKAVDEDREEHVHDDFMAFVGMDVDRNSGLKSYIIDGVIVAVVIFMVIAVLVYCDYRNRGFGSKYEMIQ